MEKIPDLFASTPYHEGIFFPNSPSYQCRYDMTCLWIKIVKSAINSSGTYKRNFHSGLRCDKFTEFFDISSHPTITEIFRVSRTTPHFLFLYRVVYYGVSGTAAENQCLFDI